MMHTRPDPSLEPRHVPLEQRDPFGEIVNAWEHPTVLKHLEDLPSSYDASVAYVHVHRPKEQTPESGLHFWNAPLSRAHFLNAALLRGSRTTAQLERDAGVKADKFYQYLRRWGVNFQRRSRHAWVIDGALRRERATVMSWNDGTGTAKLRLDAVDCEVEARYDRRERVYRALAPLPLPGLMTLPEMVLGAMLNLTVRTLRRLGIPVRSRSRAGVRYYGLADALPFAPVGGFWCSRAAAFKATNPCLCAFYDHSVGGCGLGNVLPPASVAASGFCPDFSPEDV